MFTPPRDQDDTDSDEETDTKDDNTPRPNEIRDSFEQIKLEEETKELIEGYKKELGPEDIERLDELENIYGAKNPGEIGFWKKYLGRVQHRLQQRHPSIIPPESRDGSSRINTEQSEGYRQHRSGI